MVSRIPQILIDDKLLKEKTKKEQKIKNILMDRFDTEKYEFEYTKKTIFGAKEILELKEAVKKYYAKYKRLIEPLSIRRAK